MVYLSAPLNISAVLGMALWLIEIELGASTCGSPWTVTKAICFIRNCALRRAARSASSPEKAWTRTCSGIPPTSSPAQNAVLDFLKQGPSNQQSPGEESKMSGGTVVRHSRAVSVQDHRGA